MLRLKYFGVYIYIYIHIDIEGERVFWSHIMISLLGTT